MTTPMTHRLVIHNDEEHTFPYVESILQDALGVSREEAARMTVEIHERGRTTVAMPDLASAQTAQERIFDGGRDGRLPHSQSSLVVGIESDEAGTSRLVNCGRVGPRGFQVMDEAAIVLLQRESARKLAESRGPCCEVDLNVLACYGIAIAVIALAVVIVSVAGARGLCCFKQTQVMGE